jgi:hypothetical protein
MDDGVLDEAYERMHRTGPEFRGWLSNHGPMAADALVRLGGENAVHRWLDDYSERLETAPPKARPVPEREWREALGDQTRIGEWLALMSRELDERPWQQVLATWWPRLLPGVLAGATHGVIRTGHAVRALRELDNEVRKTELGHALAYWASRWQPVPGASAGDDPRNEPDLSPGPALDAVPCIKADPDSGIRVRIGQLAGTAGWAAALHAVAPGADHMQFVDQVTVEALRRFPHHAAGDAVMLVHSVTAPAAIALIMPSLDPAEHERSARMAWAAAATVSAAYRLPTPVEPQTRCDIGRRSAADLQQLSVEHGDEHVIKLAEAAMRTPDRPAAALAVEEAMLLIPARERA